MALTTSQIFQIGAAVISFAVAIAPQFGVDPKAVALVGGALGTLWGTIGSILTTQTAQVNAVVSNIEDPNVKVPLVQAVSNLKGVAEPIKIDMAKATPDLVAAANSNATINQKIEKAT